MGRVLTEQRRISGITKNLVRSYNLDGSTGTLSYPSGRTITYSCSAVARPISAVDSTNNMNYANGAAYAP